LARKAALTRRYLAAAVAVGVASALCLVVQAILLGVVVQRRFSATGLSVGWFPCSPVWPARSHPGGVVVGWASWQRTAPRRA